MFCNFLLGTLYSVAARAEDNIEQQYHYYLQVRCCVKSFDDALQSKLQTLEEGATEDLLKKLCVLVAYDFEAAVQLKAWNDLSGIIDNAEVCKSMKVYETMADCMLCAHAEVQGAPPGIPS